MGDNLGPFGLSKGFKVVYSKVDPVWRRSRGDLPAFQRDASMAWLFCSARAFAVNPARQRARPCGLRGV